MASAVWTNAGQTYAVDLLDPATRAAQATVAYIGWGSGGTAAAVTDTALQTPNPEARASAAVTQPATDTVQYEAEITATATRVVREAAVFTAVTAGTMLLRGTHADVNLESGDRIVYTFTLRLRDDSEA